MDKPTAQQLIKKTFQNPFDRERFHGFIKNLLNHIEETPNTVYQGNLIPDAYEPYIKKLERIGRYKGDPENKIDVLVVYLKKESSLEHARTRQRNFIAWYLNGSRGGELKDAALVAFVAPDMDDWRFSLVKMEYKITETPKGKIKAKEEFTPARRYSFLVGQNENSHTAKSRLVPILESETEPTLKDLEDAFSIEKVTKEFFEKYRELYLRVEEMLDEIIEKDKKVRTDFISKCINTSDFAKKLLGQIVFLYFLQKKGWFGVKRGQDWGAGSRHFLRELFEKKHGGYNNFFNDILESLFYEALRVERPDDYYSRFDCRIPFLNGGLFDPINNYDWWNTDILLPKELFSNNYKTKEGDIGNGILDIFDRYNFTVKEDEPLEKEVAVDPEMLGKVFENLLEVKDRKSKGTYYTPREIVHYMCRESLVNYLYSELNPGSASHAEIEQKKLFGGSDPKQLKLLGSRKELIPREDIETLIKYGETVVEHENRVVNAGRETSTYSFKLPESIRKNAKSIDERLVSIRVCDPAVGSGAFLVGMMSEVIRTRNALTPYLPSRHSEHSEESCTIYDFKRHAIQNCLYGVDIDPGAVEIAKLRLWLSLVVDEEDIKQIKPLPNLDYKIVQGNSLLGVEKNLFNEKLFTELERLKPLYFNETNARKKQEYRGKIDELISQITNGHKDFNFEVYFSEVFHEKKGFDAVIANPPYIVAPSNHLKNFVWVKGNQNTYVAFLEIANKYINQKGSVAYIIPSTWLAGNNFKELRASLLNNKRIQQIIQLPYDIFEAAYVDNVIIILTGKFISNDKIKTFKFNVRDTLRYEKIKFQEFNVKDWMSSPDSVIFLDRSLLRILEAYQKIPFGLLGEIADVQRGTLPPKENEFIDAQNTVPKQNLIRWFAGQIYGYVVVSGPERYVKYEKLRENKPLEVFRGSKILGRQLVSRQFRLQFAFTREEFAFKKNLYAIYNCSKEFDYYYLLAILNSRFFSYVQVNLNASGQRDDYPALSLQDFRNFKIPLVSSNEQKSFINLVDRILAITKDNDYLENSTKQAKVHEYEKQIDQLVYKLYGLTPEEIEIVEGRR